MNFVRTNKHNRFWQQCQTVAAVREMKHEQIDTDSPPQAGDLAA